MTVNERLVKKLTRELPEDREVIQVAVRMMELCHSNNVSETLNHEYGNGVIERAQAYYARIRQHYSNSR
ncbi:MAG: hypothetical protein ABIH37_03975 [archaeon]